MRRYFLTVLRRAKYSTTPTSTAPFAHTKTPGIHTHNYESTSGNPTGSMPPGILAKLAKLQTFTLPKRVTGSAADHVMGKAIVSAWRRDGILQIAMTDSQAAKQKKALSSSVKFFGKPQAEKAAAVDSFSYAGYIGSGEEITNGIADYPEIFTVTKDLPKSDERVRQKWPCHGPCPWGDLEMKDNMTAYMDASGRTGEKLLQLTEFGLGVAPGSLTRYTKDGWHHMRVLRSVQIAYSVPIPD